MSTGISISSINRIKELAEEKQYAEALEILDTQNLDKSINPQFLRISGEIFRENKRYYDARRILLKAHQMSPQGLRIIAEIIQLYLELGYFEKAQKYYEEYLFYTTEDDVQRDYVEYMVKKGTGTDVKELASILIPILERMPEDRWNFEAVLLYDKMGHKDKALDECRYILENFKESQFVKPVIDYIEDKLDVDAYFNVFSTKEKKDNKEEFADLRELEDKLLEEDYLRMYPPEAKIMVEAEDKELTDIISKDKKTRRKKKIEDDSLDSEAEQKNKSEKPKRRKKAAKKENADDLFAESDLNEESNSENAAVEETNLTPEEKEEAIRKDREEKLDKILSKKPDIDDAKESAKKIAESVKNIDVKKTKKQVKKVAKSVKGNVDKAKTVVGEAVGVKADDAKANSKASSEIVDGIIEGVIEAPKKPVGQVVVDEELDSLIPNSLESLSEDELIKIENKKAEEDRIELEALENQLRLEDEKKAKREQRKAKKNSKKKENKDENVVDEAESESEEEKNRKLAEAREQYENLKEQFLAANDVEEEEIQPLDSLGFISVVQSDIDDKLENDMPYAAEMLHHMIDNKEFYTGEDSTKFETKASYDNHGFEVEDYEFASHEGYILQTTHEELYNQAQEDEDVPTVEIIFAKEEVIDFDDMVPQSDNVEFSNVDLTVHNENGLFDDIDDSIMTETDQDAYDDTTTSEGEMVEDTVESDTDDLRGESDISLELKEEIQSFDLPDENEDDESLLNTDEVLINEQVSDDLVEENEIEEKDELQDAIEDVEKGNIIETYSESSFDMTMNEDTINSYDENAYDETVLEHSEDVVGTEESQSQDVLLEENDTWNDDVFSEETIWDREIVDNDESSDDNLESNVVDDRNDLRIRIVITSNMSQLLMELKEGR